jgi:Ca2+-transporting ATPase
VSQANQPAPASELASAHEATAWHTLTADEVLRLTGSHASAGLSTAEVEERTRRFGPNRFTAAQSESPLRAFLRQYADPMQLVLVVAGIGSLYPLREVGTGVLLLALTVFNALLGLRQEGKAAAAVAALQKMMIVTARVKRDGTLAELPAEQLVPGDVVAVEAGDIVPADGRVLWAATLEVAESALTGESLPVSKGTEAVTPEQTPLGDRTDMVYMNTNVTRGSGEFVVVATGMSTEVGHISGLLQEEKESKTPLTRQLDALTRQIFLIAGLALLVSVVLNLARGETFTAIFHAAVAFAIAALPENMPAVVTTILAYGTQALAKVGAIMKRLQSTETLGSTSAINSDKTGTLTLNEMTAVQLVVVGRRYAVDGAGYSGQGRITHVAGQADIPLDPILLPMVLASDAVVDAGVLIGDPTEGALVALAAKGGVDAESTRAAYPRVGVLPFDAAYKLMATFHRMVDESGTEVVRCFVKGAPDELLARAATVFDADVGHVPADGVFRERYLAENARLGQEGLRVLATARKDFALAEFDAGADLLTLVADGLELLSLVGIVDPPRPAAKASIASASAAGIRVRMITGDHAVTGGAIARQLGIEGTVLTGAEFAALDDEEALERIDDVGVIARVTPQDKVRLVDLLKRQGRIGIAMGITGTDVAKDAAVMVLTDDNFSTIVRAVEMGRGLYDNLVKYIRFQMGCLFGFIVSFLGAAVFTIAGGVPFLPLQTLWINFTTMLFQAVGLGYGQPAAGLMDRLPRDPAEPILPRREMAWLVAIGLVMGGATLGVITWAEAEFGRPVALTMGVATFSLASVLFSLATRDETRTVFSMDTLSDRILVRSTAISVVTLILATVFGPLQAFLETVPLDLGQWAVCFGAALPVLVASEVRAALIQRRTSGA